jgi:hypothetical protein
MKKLCLPALLFSLFLLSYTGFCTILHVPGTYSSIQAGIYASFNGDTVLVDPGTYNEHINLDGYNIVLGSLYLTTGNSSYIAGTIIDGTNTGRVITIDTGEDSTCRIIGFTIQHGNSENEIWQFGGGVFINDASAQILNCIIQNNYAPNYGGGLSIYGSGSRAKAINCTIQNNSADSFGGGAFIGDCTEDAEIINCIISGNTINCNCDWNGGGGGVNLYHTGKLTNCLVINNSAPNAPAGGGGVSCDWGDYYGSQGIFVTGCTIANNTAQIFGGVNYVVTGGEFRNCIIWGNTDNDGNMSNYDGSSFAYCCTLPLPAGTGNISSNPTFINPLSNFRLSPGSPCVDAGNNSFNSQTLDLDGNPRIENIIDMGAYEEGTGTGLTVQVGSGNDTTQYFPIHSYYGYNYSQQIYLGSEITSGGGSAGLITKIRFFYFSGSPNFAAWNNWTVYLGNTTKTEFTSVSDWVPVASMSQVLSGIIPDPVAGTWLELTLPTPFSYTGGNIVIAVDENSDYWDSPPAQWRSFNASSNRGLLFYNDDLNPDPASPPDANIGPDITIAQVQFVITNGSNGILEGYVTEEPGCTVPVEGATITTGSYTATTNATGFYLLSLPIGSYFDVTAHHGDVSQTISPVYIMAGNTTTQDFCLQPYYPPPVNFQASLSGPLQNNVHLSWMAPGSMTDQWIHWDNGTFSGGLGYNGPATFTVASRWPVADIAPYGGTYLKKIRFVITEATAAYTLKVWKGTDASTLLVSQVVTDPYINAWNEVTLTSPVLIDGADEFWFGYEVVQTTGYPAGLAPGPAIAGKGDMINSGSGWISMKNSWGFDFNWALQGFISTSAMLAPRQSVPMAQNTSPVFNNPLPVSLKPLVVLRGPATSPQSLFNPEVTDSALPKPVVQSPVLDASVLTGYNVYRNNAELIHNTGLLFYDDPALPKGGYIYEVSAQYELGESARIGVHVDIYTCFPPTGLTASNATLTTTSADLSWIPSTISTNLQWTLEWGLAGFAQGTGTTVSVNTTPTYSVSGLDPGKEYDFYVRTYCSPSDASAWVKKTFRTHYMNCPAGAVPEAEVCGTNTNGCDLVPPAFETISCGETICGTSWLHRSHRDSDWYTFTLTQPCDVTLSGDVDFTCFIGIGSAPCPSALFYTSTTYYPGYFNSSLITRLDAAGTYYVNVAPAYQEQVACDSLNHYWIKLMCNNCLSPTALNAINLTTTSADLAWTSSGATTWNIEWGTFGFAQGSGTTITGANTNPYHLSGLTAGNYYSYYVQSNCGGGSLSNWAGPYTFTLPCPANTLPYSEDFTSQSVGITPQCWQVSTPGSPSSWIVDYTNAAWGNSPELVFKPYNPWFSGRSFMISPFINTIGMAQLNLSFNQYIYSFSAGTSCEIWTTSDGGITWVSVWSVAQTGAYGPEASNFTISTSDVGSATFQFAFAVNGYSWDIGDWHIDDISLTGVPQTGTLQGVVTACSNASALQGATVTAGTNTTTTNASGFYQFLDIPVATYDVEFSLAGYVAKSVPGVVVLNGMMTTLDTCLTLTGPPAITTVQNVTIPGGQSFCYDATQTITVAGSGTTFVVESGGSATMIAGIKINYLPGTWAKHGGYMLGKIAPNGPYCGAKSASFVTVESGVEEIHPMVSEKPGFRVYPNPTNGKFRLELTGKPLAEPVHVEIYGMRGEKVLSEELSGETVHEFSLSDKPAGIYFIKVVAGENMFTSKLIKTR